MTVAELQTLVLARLESQTSSPTFNSIASAQWTRWADDKIPGIVQFFYEQGRFDVIEQLILIDQSVSLTSGIGTLSGLTDFEFMLAVKVSSSKTECKIISALDFAKWDSSSFLTTPRSERPICTIANGQIRIKPTTVTSPAYCDHTKAHPSLTGSQKTLFKTAANEMLVEEVYQLALESLQNLEY